MRHSYFIATILAGLIAAPACASRVNAKQVTVQSALDYGVLQADTKQTRFLRVALTGFALDTRKERPPLNVAIVIDKSSSMSGAKIQAAKRAAHAALEQLAPSDIVSVVAYDSIVTVLVPATKASDRATIGAGIDRLRAGGMTALFAGLSKGAAELRKFQREGAVNRIVLLSDGRANVGPSSPGELGRLATRFRREGIVVTTVGLGLDYNEDLMVAVATKSGGQHLFVEHARDLADLFKRGFEGLASVVAQEVEVKITFGEGVRPVRALGFEADIIGQTLRTSMSQLYALQTDELLVELEVRPHPMSTAKLAAIDVAYFNLATKATDRISTSVNVSFSDDPGAVARSVNDEVAISAVERVANEKSRMAMVLRDKGRVDEARALMQGNAVFLEENARKYRSPRLRGLSVDNNEDAKNLAPNQWKRKRKQMQQRQNRNPLYDFDYTTF